nr:hypothetical protein [Brevundimonas diminuta]
MKTLKFKRQFPFQIDERKEVRYLEGKTYTVSNEAAEAALKAGAAEEVSAETKAAAKKDG